MIVVGDNVWLLFKLSRVEKEFTAEKVQSDKLRATMGTLEDLRNRDEVHAATFYNHGSPPRVRPFDDVNRVSAVYYRGNDERGPQLFNGGVYRTATFHLSLCDERRQPVVVGDRVALRRGRG